MFVIQNGCTWLEDNDSADVWSVFWPPDAYLEGVAGFVRVVVGGKSLESGTAVTLGGGEYTDEAWVASLVGGVIPPRCKWDKYWLATEVVGRP
jgi:hypothetical protein